MERLLKDKNINPNELSPLTLAFIGDTVFDMLVREDIICSANRPANDLHNLAVQKVKASAQCGFCSKIMPCLSEKEMSVFKRGRNAKSGHLPRNASRNDYHMATALEALFGYLYLSGEIERIRELYSIITEAEDEKERES